MKRLIRTSEAMVLMDILRDQVLAFGESYTHIMGVSRGGLIPAVHLSHSLNLPLALTSYSAPEGNGSNQSKKFTWQDDKHVDIDRTSRVLVVDDIADSGFTLKHIVENLEIYVALVHSAVFHHKPESVFNPDFVAEELKEDAPWLQYPWEKE